MYLSEQRVDDDVIVDAIAKLFLSELGIVDYRFRYPIYSARPLHSQVMASALLAGTEE